MTPGWELRRATEPPSHAGGRSAGQTLPTLVFGDEVLWLAREGERATDEAAELLGRLAVPEELHLVIEAGRRFEVEHPAEEVLYRKGRYLVVRLRPERARGLSRPGSYTVEPLRAPDTVFEVLPRPAPVSAAVADAIALRAGLSLRRVRSVIHHLVSYGSRHSTGAQFRTAAAWASERLRSNGYAVRTMEIPVGTRTSCNVVAEREGSSTDRSVVVVTAHLDSINHENDGGAPGADDNASGAAGVLELARCLAAAPARRDLRFVLFGGEEQGLIGSSEYVSALQQPERIHVVLNMDMIATVNGTPAPTVLLEGGRVSRPAMDALAEAAHQYTSLTVQTSLHYANSDHVPFIDAGIPAVLAIEGTDSANDNVHSERDTIDRLNYGLMLQILGMQLAYVRKACGME